MQCIPFGRAIWARRAQIVRQSLICVWIGAPCPPMYMLTVYMLTVYMLTVYMLTVYMLTVYMLTVYMLTVYMLTVYIMYRSRVVV